MSDVAVVEALFFAALQRGEASDRAAYLTAACGGNAGLRRRVERLLNAHLQAGNFLSRTAFDQLGARPACDTEELAPPAAGRSAAPPGQGEACLAPTEDGLSADDEDAVLAFLQRSTRPGALGRLGHYEVFEVLGRGGFGIVFRAFDEVLQRVVAVKVLATRLAANSPPRKRFLREARSFARVRHENVVHVYAVEEQPLPFLVMEYVPGETLERRLRRSGPLSLVETLKIGRQIAEGLAAAHATGLIHRDIKPGNILIEPGPRTRVKITDFGLARAADDTGESQFGLVAGTPLFMAPEQAKGEPLDHRADLFSLGSVLYTMCTGQSPFRAASTLATLKRVSEDTSPPIREINPDVPQWLCELIARLHAKNPAERFGSAREVTDLLTRHLERTRRPGSDESPRAPEPSSEPAPCKASPEAPTPGPGARPRRWLAAVSALALVSVLGLAEATGVTKVRSTVIRLFSPEGSLLVEVDDPGVSVKVDGSEIVITGAGAKEIRLKPGNYTVEARKDGKLVRQELVTVTNNGRQVVRISRESQPGASKKPADVGLDKRPAKFATAAAWERAVSSLPAVEQVKAVAARLQELNPGFNGEVETVIENGIVRGLTVRSDRLIDLTPLRVLTGLRSLDCSGNDAFKGQLTDGSTGRVRVRSVDKSRLIDLAPLKSLPLTRLSVTNSDVYDLSPLAGMKLRSLFCGSTKVFDLLPLKGMPLEELDCSFTRVADLAPLKGMKLTLGCFGNEVTDLTPLKGMPLGKVVVGRGVTDLSPLKGMPLVELDCSGSGVFNLTPLKGMPLTILAIGGTKVTDLAPLKGMKTLKRLWCCDLVRDLSPLKGLALNYLHAGPLVTDLSPLAEMPLEKVEIAGFQAKRDMAILRGMKTLKTINDKPAEQFWKEIDEKAKAP